MGFPSNQHLPDEHLPNDQHLRLSRRTFALAALGGIAIPRAAWAKSAGAATVFYVAVGSNLTRYGVDSTGLTLASQATTQLPAAIQYIWIHPTRPLMYAAYSNRFQVKDGHTHGVMAFTIDRANGNLTPFGQPMALPSRPINITVDRAGRFLLVAYNQPSGLTVLRLGANGAIEAPVEQAETIDAGIYAHQVRVAPSGRFVVLVTRGNDATPTTPEDPGAIKVFRFNQGQLSHEASVTRGNGLGFGPRHVDFHPTKPWMFVSMERNNQLLTYAVQPEGIGAAPLFTKDTLRTPGGIAPVQYAGPIHVHPNGKYVYLANRSDGTVDFAGRKVHGAGENTIAMFTIDPKSGEPTLAQTIETNTFHNRTFSIHPNGRMLVAASVAPLAVREGDQVRNVAAGLSVFGIGKDGKLSFARTYDVDVGPEAMFWCGMVAL